LQDVASLSTTALAEMEKMTILFAYSSRPNGDKAARWTDAGGLAARDRCIAS